MRRVLCGILIALSIFALLLCGYGAYKTAMRQYLQYKYPVAYVQEIANSADAYGINPYMALAVVRCESSFRADACSGAGAVGLMQIMPSTGAWIAEEQGRTGGYDDSLLLDPATNIDFGCWYLQYLSDLFDGDFQKIICAYNAGQGSVAKWLLDPTCAENGRLTRIPFPQTATYYENVVTAYRQYMTLYPALFSGEAAVAEAGGGCYNTQMEDLPCWKSF